MSESLEIRRKRLIHRSVYTGMKETDILLGAFARTHVPDFTAEELGEYENLLGAGDPNILDWALERAAPPVAYDGPVMKLLQNFKIAR
jgi:succinate dehydrogenase flavin-adding protein (antitoxin of CptAB toxin-antitoxin module)